MTGGLGGGGGGGGLVFINSYGRMETNGTYMLVSSSVNFSESLEEKERDARS